MQNSAIYVATVSLLVYLCSRVQCQQLRILIIITVYTLCMCLLINVMWYSSFGLYCTVLCRLWYPLVWQSWLRSLDIGIKVMIIQGHPNLLWYILKLYCTFELLSVLKSRVSQYNESGPGERIEAIIYGRGYTV